jgi:hypothetical protein
MNLFSCGSKNAPRRAWNGGLKGGAGLVLAAGLLMAATGRSAEPLAPLLGCRSLADATARLACFDRESAKLSPDQAVAAPASAAAPNARPVDARQSFGLPEGQITAQEVAAGARPAELAKIEAHVSAISLTRTGQATFTLDNGQVWRELGSEGDLLAKPGDAVAISVGVFHSYWLQFKSGRGCKVRRVL